MTDKQALGDRIQRSLLRLIGNRGQKVTLAEFGEFVAKKEGRDSPYSPQAVSAWIGGEREPPLSVVAAIAALTGVSESWLAFGRGDMVDDPRGARAHPEQGRAVPLPSRVLDRLPEVRAAKKRARKKGS